MATQPPAGDKKTNRWRCRNIPEGPGASAAIEAELNRLADFMIEPGIDAHHYRVWFTVPKKPRGGMVAIFAQNVVGNKGGMYQYTGSAWVLVGTPL